MYARLEGFFWIKLADFKLVYPVSPLLFITDNVYAVAKFCEFHLNLSK